MKIVYPQIFLAAAMALSLAGCTSSDSESVGSSNGEISNNEDPNDENSLIGIMRPPQCSDRVIDVDHPPSEVAFLGNSLLLGNLNFGLSASDSTKDYYAHMDSAFRKLNPEYVGVKVMAKNLEFYIDEETQKSRIDEQVVPFISEKTDLVLVQLGDNIEADVPYEDMENIVDGLLDVICEKAPNAKVAWIGEWYSTEKKQYILEESSKAHNAQFIDISDLNVEENQGRVGDVSTFPDVRVQPIDYISYSVSGDTITVSFEDEGKEYESSVVVEEYHSYEDEGLKRIDLVGHQGIVTTAVAASHPNDRGFALIAERILSELGF